MKFINILIATIWLINGLVCKILNLVPRHQLIVANIFNINTSRTITIVIGVLEVLMALWIITNIKKKLNTIIQIVTIIIMNIIEILTSANLLLWGKLNGLFALILVGIIYFNFIQFNKIPHETKKY